MRIGEKAALIASCIGVWGFTARDAVNVLIEETRGGLTHTEAICLIADAHAAQADDWVPLRDWERRWQQ